MRWALLGDDDDGLELVQALLQTGRHELLSFVGSAACAEQFRRAGAGFQADRDLEEMLANPAIEGVIVASSPAARPIELRRVIQSERHVICVHPLDGTPDSAYEAALMQGDTGCLLWPAMPDCLHPVLRRFAQLLRAGDGGIGPLELLDHVQHTSKVVLNSAGPTGKPSMPSWDAIRLIAGELAEVSGLSLTEELQPTDALLISGRFERGGLLRATYLSARGRSCWEMTAYGTGGVATLSFSRGISGPAEIVWQRSDGVENRESHAAWDRWPSFVVALEQALAQGRPTRDDAGKAPPVVVDGLGWQTAIRSLELDDATRRSVQRRRVSTLEYQEATEEVGFKGTMTLVGCGIVWLMLLLLIFSVWLPWLGWLILPLIGGFLALQLLRWIVPASPPGPTPPAVPTQNVAGNHFERGDPKRTGLPK